MALSSRQIAQLQKLVAIAEKLLTEASVQTKENTKSRKAGGDPGKARLRRTGKDLAAFRKMLKAERKRGVPVAELAAKHGVSTSYIYQVA